MLVVSILLPETPYFFLILRLRLRRWRSSEPIFHLSLSAVQYGESTSPVDFFSAGFSSLDTISAYNFVNKNTILMLVFDIFWTCYFFLIADSSKVSKHAQISLSCCCSFLTLAVLSYRSHLVLSLLFDWYI